MRRPTQLGSACLLSVILLATSVLTASAQAVATLRVVNRTEILARPAANADVVMAAVPGTIVELIEKEGSWYWVMLPPDMNGTRHPGWIQARDVEIAAAGQQNGVVLELNQKVDRLQLQLDQLQSDGHETAETVPARTETGTDKPRRRVEARQDDDLLAQTSDFSTGTAQSQNSGRASHRVPTDWPKIEIAGGYAILHDGDISQNFPSGWFASFGRNFNSVFGIVGEMSGNYKTMSLFGTDINASSHSFMAGPKVVTRQGQVTPFGQILFGGVRSSIGALGDSASETDFGIQPGGGVDITVGSNLGVRIGSNFRFIRANGGTFNEFQFVAGIVFRGQQ